MIDIAIVHEQMRSINQEIFHKNIYKCEVVIFSMCESGDAVSWGSVGV